MSWFGHIHSVILIRLSDNPRCVSAKAFFPLFVLCIFSPDSCCFWPHQSAGSLAHCIVFVHLYRIIGDINLFSQFFRDVFTRRKLINFLVIWFFWSYVIKYFIIWFLFIGSSGFGLMTLSRVGWGWWRD